MSNQNECEVLFPVKSGIFGVGRLATRLKALTARRQIGEWHIGHWLDWKHTAIRISFATPEDAELAKSVSLETANMLPQAAANGPAVGGKQALAMSALLPPRPTVIPWPADKKFQLHPINLEKSHE